MLGLGLSIVAPLYVPEGGFKVLEPVNMPMEITDTQSVFLNASNTDSYSIPNLPAWCTLNTSTGELTVTPDGTVYGQEKFDVVLTNIDGDLTIANGLTITLFREQVSISGKLDEHSVTPINENSTITSIQGSSLSYPMVYDRVNDYWAMFLGWNENYGINNQFKIVNFTSMTETYNADGFLNGTRLSFVNTVANDEHSYCRIDTELIKYDCDTNTISTLSSMPTELGSGILYPSAELGIDGKIIFGGQDGNQITLAEYDTTNDTYDLYTNTNGDGDDANNRQAVGDATHFYQSTNGNGTGYRLYTIDRTTRLPVKLMNGPSWINPYQGKYGCWVWVDAGSTDVNGDPIPTTEWHWLYNGALIHATNGLNQDTCPWDNQGEPFVKNEVIPTPKPYDVDLAGMSPDIASGGNSASVWVKHLQTDPLYSEITLNNITKYPIELKRVLSVPVNNSVLSCGYRSGGFSLLDLSDGSSQPFPGFGSNYCHNLHTDNKVYLGGYPSGSLYMYDPLLPWDNFETDYNPNIGSTAGNNPVFIGYTRYDGEAIGGISIGGTGGGQHTLTVMLSEGSMLWCFGHYSRDGTGLGVTSVDTLDQYRMTGYRDEAMFSNYKPVRGCATEDYLVCLCETLSAPNALGVVAMNKATKVFKVIDLPTLAEIVWLDTQIGSTIIEYGENKVCVASANSSYELVLIGLNLDTDTILYTNTITGTYTKGGSVERMSDGNVYLGVDGKTVLLDTENGFIEEVSTTTLKGERDEGPDGNVYLVNGAETYSIGLNKTPEIFTEIPQGTELIGTPAENGSFVTMVDNGDNTYTFTEDGTQGGYYDINMYLTQTPVSPIDWDFEFNVESGETLVWAVRNAGVWDSGVAPLLTLTPGVHSISGAVASPISTGTKIQMNSLGNPTVYTLTVRSNRERP